MRAIAVRELRRLLPLVGMTLLAALLVGLLDLAFARHAIMAYRGAVYDPRLSVWFCGLLFAVSALTAPLIGRTGNTTEMRFLSLWPTTRRRVWLVKLPLRLILAAATCALSFVICSHVLHVFGYKYTYLQQSLFVGTPERLHEALIFEAVIWFLAFSLSLFWSQLLGAAMSMVVSIASWAALVLGVSLGWELGLLRHWSPWLREFHPATGEEWLGPPHLPPALLTLGAIVLVSAAFTFWRVPLLEGRRRARTGLSAMGVLAVLAALLSVPLVFDFVPIQPGQVRAVWMPPSGGSIVLDTNSYTAHGRSVLALWVVNPSTGKLRLLARGPSRIVALANEHSLHFQQTYGDLWEADLDTGRLQWLGRNDRKVSPSGRYYTRRTHEGYFITDGIETIPLAPGTTLVGWSPDERFAYVDNTSALFGAHPPPWQVQRISLPGGQQQTVARIALQVTPGGYLSVSPGGKWIVGENFDHDRKERLVRLLVSASAGTTRALPSLPFTGVWSADDRYVWCWAPGRNLQVLDTTTLTMVSEIGPDRLGGQPQQPRRSPSGDRVYFQSRPASGNPAGGSLWEALITGQQVHRVGQSAGDLDGVAADGSLVVHDDKELFLLDPQTKQKRVLVTLASGRP